MEGRIIDIYSFIFLTYGLLVAAISKYKGIRGPIEISQNPILSLDRSKYKKYITSGIISDELERTFRENDKIFPGRAPVEISKEYGNWWIIADERKKYMIVDDGEKLKFYLHTGQLLNFRLLDAFGWWGFFSLTLAGLLIPVINWGLPYFSNVIHNTPPQSNIFPEIMIGFFFISFLFYGTITMVNNIGEEGKIICEETYEFLILMVMLVPIISDLSYRLLIYKSENKELKDKEPFEPVVFFFASMIFGIFYFFGTPPPVLISGFISILPLSIGFSLIRFHFTQVEKDREFNPV